MTRSILRPAFALLIPLAMFAFASAAPAKDKKPTDVKAVCLKEVKEHLKVKHEHAHDIELTPSREWQQTSTQSGISGTRVLKVADNKLTTSLGTAHGSDLPRPYRYGYGYLDENQNYVVDPGEKKLYFEISDFATNYVFYENPR